MRPSRDSHAEYSRRLHKVLEYIDQHLDESLELRTLAEVAHFSSFHFHRLFTAWMDETLGDYLRRRRLEVAALHLVAEPEAPVLGIALSVGFGSTEAFARAFKSRFGCTATAWREREAKRRMVQLESLRASRPTTNSNSNPGQAVRKPDQEQSHPPGHHETSQQGVLEVSMKVKVVDRQPSKVAYLRHVGPYGQPLSDFWQDTVYPWLETNDLLNRARFGVSHDDPDITAADKCRYDACAEVPPDFTATGQTLTTTIPGGKYAVTRFRGTTAEIEEAWAALLRDWLPASGLQLDARPFFEYYSTGSTYDPETGAFDCDLCVPVVAL